LTEYALTSGGTERSYFVHLPEGYDSASEWPVIVALHGLTWQADKWFNATWKASASEIDYVLVLPEALDLNWADRSFEPDVPFITDVLTELETKVCVDSARIYASGASDGADMVTRLACGAGDRFAAMRPYIGMNYPELFESEGCDQPSPVPMTSYIGTNEPYYDLAGIDEGVAMWAERNGCQGEPVTEEVAGGVTTTRYDDCSDDATVEIYILEGVEHEAAQIECEGNDPGFCTTYSFDTTGSMLEFFSRYSR
jgi:polyhydroxybutyrate depolymerase